MKPSKSELLYWQQDRVTKWFMEELHRQFQPWPIYEPHKTIEDSHRLAGNQQVLRVIAKLCDLDA